MIHAHAAGELVKPPAAKVSSGGKPYALLIIKAGSVADSQIVTGLVFGELAQAALSLEQGDSLSITGSAKLGVYDRGGEPTPSITVFVSKLLSGKPEPRTKRQATRSASQGRSLTPAQSNAPNASYAAGGPIPPGGGLAEMENDLP